MDRLTRTIAGCGLGLGLLLTGTGCRSMRSRSEVPSGRSFPGQSQPPIGFSTTPDPSGMSSAAPQLGMPTPGGPNYGAPTGNSFGAPGTSGLSNPPTAVGGLPSSLTPSGAADPTAGASPFGAPPIGAK